jgi:hypothetical protein
MNLDFKLYISIRHRAADVSCLAGGGVGLGRRLSGVKRD